MDSKRTSRWVATAALVGLPILAPAVANAQEHDSNYEMRRVAGHLLYAQSRPVEARVLLEELGDDAIGGGNTAGAAQAYYDAAWIANEEVQRLEAEFDLRMVGVGVQKRPDHAADEALRLARKAEKNAQSISFLPSGLSIDANLSNSQLRLMVGRLLYALGKHDLAVTVLDRLGDDALASGDNASAGQAYYEAAWIATEEAQRRARSYDPKLVGIAQPNTTGFATAALRLLEKAKSTGAMG